MLCTLYCMQNTVGFMRSKQVFVVRLLFLVWLCLTALTAHAVIVEDLYRTQVPVADQGDAERKQALAQALKEVVRKVSGTAAAAEHPHVQAAAENAQSLVAEFGYEAGSGEVPSRLRVVFSPSAIDRLLSEAELPVWGENRPAVLAWIAVDEGGRRALVGSDGASRLVAPLEQQAAERGQPLVIPLMDLEDSSKLSSADVWGFFFEPVKQASGRYAHDAILMARVARGDGGQWQGSWQLQVQGEQWSDRVTADSSTEVLKKVIDAVAEQMATRYAVTGAAAIGDEVIVDVSGIDSLRDFAELSQYLGTVAPVRSAQPILAQPNQIRFRLTLKGTLNQVQEYFALERRLRPVLESAPIEQTPAEAIAAPHLHYRWQP